MMNRQNSISRPEAGDGALATTGASFALAKPLAAKNARHGLGFEARVEAGGFRRISAARFQDRRPWSISVEDSGNHIRIPVQR